MNPLKAFFIVLRTTVSMCVFALLIVLLIRGIGQLFLCLGGWLFTAVLGAAIGLVIGIAYVFIEQYEETNDE